MSSCRPMWSGSLASGMCGRAGGWATCAGRRNGGSIYLADQKIPLAVPRVRDRLRNQEVPLPTYERLQAPRTLDAGLLHKVLGGLSTREYERCAEAVPEAFGLSASTVSRRFKAGQCAKAAGTAGTASRPLRRGRPAPRRQDVRGG